MGMLTIPFTMHSLALWQHERLWEHGYLCEFATYYVELLNPPNAVLLQSDSMPFFFSLQAQKKFTDTVTSCENWIYSKERLDLQ